MTVFYNDTRYCAQVLDSAPDGGEAWGTEFFARKRDAYAHARRLAREHADKLPAGSMLATPEVCEFGQTTTLARCGTVELEVIFYG